MDWFEPFVPGRDDHRRGVDWPQRRVDAGLFFIVLLAAGAIGLGFLHLMGVI